MAVGLAMTERKSVNVQVLNATSALHENARFTGEVKLIKKVIHTESPVKSTKCE